MARTKNLTTNQHKPHELVVRKLGSTSSWWFVRFVVKNRRSIEMNRQSAVPFVLHVLAETAR